MTITEIAPGHDATRQDLAGPRPGRDTVTRLKPERTLTPTNSDTLEWPFPQPAGEGPAAGHRRPITVSGGLRPASLRLWAAALAAGVTVATVIEPVPDGADTTVPVWVDIIGTATIILLATGFLALLSGRRWGFGPAAYGSAGLVALSALCPTSGHHSFAAWWFGQLAISIGLFVGSLRLRSRASRSNDPALR